MVQSFKPIVVKREYGGRIGLIYDFNLTEQYPQSFYPFARMADPLSEFFISFTELMKLKMDELFITPEAAMNAFTTSIDSAEINASTIKDVFNNYAFSDHRAYGPLAHGLIMRTLLENIMVSFNNEQRIVSFGSGASLQELFLSILLSKFGIQHKVMCLDISEKIVEQVNAFKNFLIDQHKTLSISNLKDFSIYKDEMEQSSLRSSSADLVLSIHSLFWSLNWRGALSEFKRILDPKGPRKLMIITQRESSQINDKPVSDLTPIRLLDHLESIGFSIDKIRILYGSLGDGYMEGTLIRQCIYATLHSTIPAAPWRECVDPEDVMDIEPAKNLFLKSLLEAVSR